MLKLTNLLHAMETSTFHSYIRGKKGVTYQTNSFSDSAVEYQLFDGRDTF